MDNYTVWKGDAVGLQTSAATVQVFCVLPMAEDSKADHLLELVKIQAVTRRDARKATQEENSLGDKTAPNLLATIHKLQGSDPLCLQL